MGVSLSYDAAVAALKGALTFGIHPSLDGIRALTQELGRPQDAFASVQVTGTNGKSSVTRMTAALLAAHGVRSSAYTSPGLTCYPERFEIMGAEIAEDRFASAISAAVSAANAAGRPAGNERGATEFELLTAAALWLFREEKVDIACLEVGMGGRWDATSVVEPSVAVITGVGIDHAEHLGTTREAIAADKACIIKPASTPILGPATEGVDDVFIARAEECDTHPRAVRPYGRPTPVIEDLTVRYRIVSRQESPDGATVVSVKGVHGEYDEIAVNAPAYQAPNVATAIAAAEAAMGRDLDPEVVRGAFEVMTFPGRFEVLARNPWVVIDGAHNPQAARALVKSVESAWPDPANRPAVVLGVLADKDAEGIVTALSGSLTRFICTTPASPRALSADALADTVLRVTGTRPAVVVHVREAIDAALAMHSDNGVLVTGSFVTAGEARALFR